MENLSVFKITIYPLNYDCATIHIVETFAISVLSDCSVFFIMSFMRPSVLRLRWNLLALANAQDRRRRIVAQRKKTRAMMRLTIDALQMLPESEFVKTFRLGKVEVRYLSEILTPILRRQLRRDAIFPDLKILIALAFYATGSYQTLVGQNSFLNVSQSTVSRAVREVTEALNHPNIYKRKIVWPLNLQDRNTVKAKFFKFGIPGVLGCIDGTHVAILRPAIHEERYFNRKGYHSLNVMIICDAEMNILCVDASSPGSSHDSSIWQSHPLCNHLKELCDAGEHVFLLGDSGYPLRMTMMTPLLNTLEGTPEHHYYQLHVTARNTVERCIGVLKARFRCLLAARALHYNSITAGKIVNACCILHNMANKKRLPVTPLTHEEAVLENLRQHEIEREISADAELGLQESNSRVNPELLRGRMLQRALIERLWRDRNTQ